MENYFTTKGEVTEVAPERRPQGLVSIHLAVALDKANAVKPNRANRRRGLTFLYEVAARPARHTVCKHCNRRTWTSLGRACRRCFLKGEGDDLDFGPAGLRAR